MNLLARTRLRVVAVLLLTLLVGLGPMARSLAESDNPDKPVNGAKAGAREKVPYSVAGVLTSQGSVTVNDNRAPTGTTVLYGSEVATGGDGIASIDLGPKGLLEMQTDTKILLTLPAEQIEVELKNCGVFTQSVPNELKAHVKVANPHTVRIYVTVGSVRVRFADRKETTTINQFEDKTLDNVSDVNTAGNAVFTIDCNRRPLAAWWIPTSLAGLAALAVGVTRNKNKPPPNPLPTPPPASPISPP